MSADRPPRPGDHDCYDRIRAMIAGEAALSESWADEIDFVLLVHQDLPDAARERLDELADKIRRGATIQRAMLDATDLDGGT